ncbi:MAG: signal peptidase I [Burkholderiales bacterium]|nr:signal peptidase I [Burkholderiales bacterium]
MENGYFILILGLVGVISEWTDFATVLFVLVILSGSILIVDKLYWAKTRSNAKTRPHYIHYAYEFFPVVLGVFVLRAFLFEAYQIPSSSMRPNLTVGDFILVNKYTLGIREPFTNKVIIPINQVKRGDVVVFKDPLAKNRDLIKRVVAIGGDKIEYYNKRLAINGVPLNYTEDGSYTYSEDIPPQGDIEIDNEQFIENLSGVKHRIITWDKISPLVSAQVQTFPDSQNCTYQGNDGFTCIVPKGKYFMMGDNRDNSFDSRYWGFVTQDAILGKAIFVWLNFHDFKRIGTKI